MMNNREIIPHRGGGRGRSTTSLATSNRIIASNTHGPSSSYQPEGTTTISTTTTGGASISMSTSNRRRPMTANSNATSATAAAAAMARIPPPTLLCNLCQKPLATTCFLCACDCIFCEECTYSHFEQSSHCPICRKTLTENDFTELVVADATNNSTNDITKTTYQALFSKQSKSNSSTPNNNVKGLPYSDICFSLIKQMEVVKQSSKFILKQLLISSNTQNRKVAFVVQQNNKLKSDVTLLKQGQSTQRIQYEQINNELKNKLNARESTIQELNMKLNEKEQMLEQFRRLHRKGGHVGDDTTASIAGQSYHHQIPPSNDTSSRGHHRHHHRNSTSSIGHRNNQNHHRNNNNHQHLNNHNNNHQHHMSSGMSVGASTIASVAEPPLKGLMMQRQAHQMAQQKALVSTRRGPNIGLGRSRQQQHSSSSNNIGGGSSSMMMPPPPPSTQPFTRPFSSNNSISSNSVSSNTPRVRDLSHNTSFNFSGGSNSGSNSLNGGGGGGGQRLNKRRRSDKHHPNTSSTTPGAASHIMSPSTAFTLNQGAHTVNRGPRWM